MNPIHTGRPPRAPGSVDTSANSNLSKIAAREGLFQGKADGADSDEATDHSGKAKGGKAGGKGHAHVKPAGLGAVDGTDPAAPQGTLLGAQTSQPSLLPSDAEPSAAVGASGKATANPELAATSDLAGTDGANQAVTQATTQLAQDLQLPGVSQATLQADVTALSTALDQAGVTLPLSAVVHDIVDPTGQGTAPSAKLTAAAQAVGLDLSQDSIDPTEAQTALKQTLAATPVVTAAVDVATAHVARTSALSGADAAADLHQVAQSLGSDDGSGLAALYAAAAKAGVDLTGKDNDNMSKAKNSSATAQMKAADKKTYAQNNANAANAGGGSSQGTGGGGSTNYGSAAKGNTTTYAALPKTGPTITAGGWDTSGDAPIAPNPNNPIDWEKTYGIKDGFSSVSLDDMLAQLPQLTSQYPDIKQTLIDAANSVTPPIPPQLLLTTLGVETSYATNFGNNAKDGPFQFIESTFAEYGKGDRTNMRDGAFACATYYRHLLDANDQHMVPSMRDYNGDVHLGASPTYQADQQNALNGNVNAI